MQYTLTSRKPREGLPASNEIDMATDLQKLEFASFCIEEYKKATNQGGRDVEQMFERRGVLAFLFDHFEALHTQGTLAILDDINEFLKHHPE